MEMHEIDIRNRNLAHEYFNVIYRINRSEEHIKMFDELQKMVYERYTQKGIILRSIGDVRLANCFSELVKIRDKDKRTGHQTVHVFVNDRNEPGGMNIPHKLSLPGNHTIR